MNKQPLNVALTMEQRAELSAMTPARRRQAPKKERSTMDIDQYIRDLPWSNQVTGDEKTLVEGNLRGFFAEVAIATKPLFDAAVAIEQQIDEQSPTDGLIDHPDDYQIAVTLTLAEVRALTRAINRTGWADVGNCSAQVTASEVSDGSA